MTRATGVPRLRPTDNPGISREKLAPKPRCVVERQTHSRIARIGSRRSHAIGRRASKWEAVKLGRTINDLRMNEDDVDTDDKGGELIEDRESRDVGVE
jgi:hypothetical protein